MKNILLIIFFFILISFSSFGVEYDFFKGQKTEIKDPLKLRDPFKKPVLRGSKKVLLSVPNKVGDNSYSNIPSIAGIPVENIFVVGVMLGKNRRAIVKSKGNKETFIIKEGMALGADKAMVKAIMPGGVVLVEKIKNVYDQFEYLETLLPITNE
jgi:hypothetical protein